MKLSCKTISVSILVWLGSFCMIWANDSIQVNSQTEFPENQAEEKSADSLTTTPVSDSIIQESIVADTSLPQLQNFMELSKSIQKQADSKEEKIKKIKKKITLEDNPESYHARRAAKWAILPGGGQIYNKKWWKVPIAWGMIGAGGYFIYNSASNMRTYNKALDWRNSGKEDPFKDILSEQQLIIYRNYYRRNLHLSVFGTAGLWTLTILDAVVDAHLKTYTISDNLSIKFKPKVLRVYNNSVPSLSITLFL